jgi:hypothetical protein
MSAHTQAPRSAAEAAHLLAKQGKHVHYVSDGAPACLKGSCGPSAVPLPSEVQERARLARLALAFEIRRL